MSMEDAILKLAAAIDKLADVCAGQAASGPEAAPAADPTKPRGRPRKNQTDTQSADAPGTTSGDDTGSPASDTTAGSSKTTVDAGTGQVAVVSDAAALRARARELGVKVGATDGGAEKLQALLRKHAGVDDETQQVGFSKVPDEAVPAFIADCEALTAMAD